MEGETTPTPPIEPPETSRSSDDSQQEEEENDDDDHVMSEIHLGCPPKFSGSFVSHFTFSLPPGNQYILMKRFKNLSDGPTLFYWAAVVDLFYCWTAVSCLFAGSVYGTSQWILPGLFGPIVAYKCSSN